MYCYIWTICTNNGCNDFCVLWFVIRWCNFSTDMYNPLKILNNPIVDDDMGLRWYTYNDIHIQCAPKV